MAEGLFRAIFHLVVGRFTCLGRQQLKVLAGNLIGQEWPSVSDDRNGAAIVNAAEQTPLCSAQRLIILVHHANFGLDSGNRQVTSEESSASRGTTKAGAG